MDKCKQFQKGEKPNQRSGDEREVEQICSNRREITKRKTA